MKADYNLNIKPINTNGELIPISRRNIRLKVEYTLKYEDGTKRTFKGIISEVE